MLVTNSIRKIHSPEKKEKDVKLVVQHNHRLDSKERILNMRKKLFNKTIVNNYVTPNSKSAMSDFTDTKLELK